MKTKQLFLFVFCFLAYATSSFGLAKETHESINLTISNLTIKKFSLDLYLKNILKIESGVKQEIRDSMHCPKEVSQTYEEGCTIGNLLQWGGKKEDEPDFRSFRHFHNPLEPLERAGLKHSDLGRSSIIWAQSRDQSYGKYSWQDVRGYYHSALTSTDITARGDYFSETFRGLGQLMHLIQDSSVPLHTRDDIHIIFSYEGWLETLRNEEPETFFNWVSNPIGYDESILNLSPNPLAPIPIAKIADTDQYARDNLDIDTTASASAGIAEYSNANFFSEGTAFDQNFPFPNWSSVEIAVDEIPDPRNPSRTVLRLYYKKFKDGENNENKGYLLATVGYLKDYVLTYFPAYAEILRRNERPALDGNVYRDYASLLIPRAVGYSAGLLKYFFRGELQVSALPIFYKNGIQYVRVKIKNMTPNETMENGYFVLAYRYTPSDGPTDGSKDKFGIARYKDNKTSAPCDKLEYGKDMTIDFIIDPTIPKENLNSVKLTLAYRGTLGNEKGDEDGTVGAVIGKVFTLGEVKFDEEWDNGLTGKYPWMHTDFDTSKAYPGHGTTSNVIEGGTLIKDNIRFAGYKNASANGSFIGVEPQYPGHQDGFPILITPKTSLQFKIDQMSINQIPPAQPGYTSHYQGLWLHFNNGLVLQLTQEGQGVLYTPTTATWTFDLGLIFVDNIYQMFKDAGITIPEPLYLNKISFSQQLFELEEASAVDHHHHMEIDSIYIVEEKEDEVKPQQ